MLDARPLAIQTGILRKTYLQIPVRLSGRCKDFLTIFTGQIGMRDKSARSSSMLRRLSQCHRMIRRIELMLTECDRAFAGFLAALGASHDRELHRMREWNGVTSRLRIQAHRNRLHFQELMWRRNDRDATLVERAKNLIDSVPTSPREPQEGQSNNRSHSPQATEKKPDSTCHKPRLYTSEFLWRE